MRCVARSNSPRVTRLLNPCRGKRGSAESCRGKRGSPKSGPTCAADLDLAAVIRGDLNLCRQSGRLNSISMPAMALAPHRIYFDL
jgi:hypothetical protein